jgi:hypothetical protein
VRLPVALLLALAFLAALTVMRSYSPATYDAELALNLTGSHGCLTETGAASVTYSCWRASCQDTLHFNFSVVMYATVRGNYTASEVTYFGGTRRFRVYLCSGTSRSLELRLPPPERQHGLFRQADIGVHVYVQAGRIAVVSDVDGSSYDIGPVQTVCLACEGGEACMVPWPEALSVAGEAVRGVADALYVFVRLDQPASLVEVEALNRGASSSLRIAAAVPEEGPDLSGAVAAIPAGVRQERGRYYIQIAVRQADGSETLVEVPADAGAHVPAQGRCYSPAAWYADVSRCSYAQGCSCAGEVPWYLVDRLSSNLYEPPPIAARGGAVALPAGRHALLFVLAWPAPLNSDARGANYTVTVTVRGARPALTR